MAKTTNRKVASVSLYFDAEGKPGEVHIVEKIQIADPPMIATRKTDLKMGDLAADHKKALAGLVSALQDAGDAKHAKAIEG